MTEKMKMEAIVFYGNKGILIQDITLLKLDYDARLKPSIRMPTLTELEKIIEQCKNSLKTIKEGGSD